MTQTGNTKDVDTLLGNPHKAILSMAVPIAIAMLAQAANNLVDSLWVSIIGTDAIAAVGYAFPLFFIIIGFGNGIGIGASAVISRRIGANDREGADRSAAQAFMLSLAASAVLGVILVLALDPLMSLFCTGNVYDLSLAYGYPIFGCSIIAVHVGVMSALLRAEGAAKRSMKCQLYGAFLNIVLDPIFMFVFGWGVAGAAWATVVSMVLGIAMSCYWFFKKKDTYLDIRLRHFRFDAKEIRLILSVGIPAALNLIITSVSIMLMNGILTAAAGSDGVAIYTVAWRVLQMIQIPMMGIGAALVPVVAAAYGMRRMDRCSNAYWYADKLAAGLTLLLGVIMAIFAYQIAGAFTTSAGDLQGGIAQFLRVAAVFLPFSALGFLSSNLFQAFGLGLRSLVIILLINLLQLPFCYILVCLGNGLTAIFWGVCLTEIIGSLFGFTWAAHTLRKLSRLPGMISGSETEE